jgi:hypothetical protein
MVSRFRNLILTSAALCATAAFAAEQKTVEVPFGFVAKNHAYHAGSYAIAVNWTRSLVTLSAIGKSSQPLQWIMVPGDTDPNHPKVGFTFDVTGTGHVLRTIQYGMYSTPNLDPKPKQRVESATTIGE